MEKRYQVFISSTFQDLQGARQEVSQALLRADCFPAGMELFPAADEEQFEYIKTIIDQSDYYILISAGRYGSIHPETGLSYTEMEYDYAVETGKPVIRLLHKDPFNELKGEFIEQTERGKQNLNLFRDKLSKGRLVKYWNNPSELMAEVVFSLQDAIKRYPARGWTRSDSLIETQLDVQVATLATQAITPQMLVTSTRLTDGVELAAVSLHFPGKSNVLGDWFARLTKDTHLGIEFHPSDSGFELIEFLAINEAGQPNLELAREISGALDNRQAALYFGSVEELTTKVLSAPADTIKAIAKIGPKQFRTGVVRIGATVVVLYAAQGVGGAIAKIADGMGSAAQQVALQVGHQIAARIDEIAEEDGQDAGIVIEAEARESLPKIPPQSAP